jgi:hypothetical protein
MPRFTLYRPTGASTQAAVPENLRSDSRVRVIGEMPQMLLFESSKQVANEWAARLSGWVLSPERRASIPDPRPDLKQRAR